ncbi:MAG: PEP-CTERM sorting domain-containing protein [Thermoguttaceae bacterium]
MARFSFSAPRCNRVRTVTVLMAVLGVLACTTSALAQGGTVLSASATPNGYSLLDMAATTAAYNEGGGTGTAPDVPFQVLVLTGGSATVNSSTMMYLPVIYTDDSLPLPTAAPFPTDITDQHADALYLDGVANTLYGVTGFFVQVDGQTTPLTDDYVSGVAVPLPDGANNYIVSASFLTPLTDGQHTIGIGGYIGGQSVVFVSDSINSVPEPSTIVLLGVGAIGLLGYASRRRRRTA